MTPGARDHDLVVFGATGFVGRLLAAYLAEHAPAGTRIALAGRSRSRLLEVRAALPPAARDWPVIEADSDACFGSIPADAISRPGRRRGRRPGRASPASACR